MYAFHTCNVIITATKQHTWTHKNRALKFLFIYSLQLETLGWISVFIYYCCMKILLGVFYYFLFRWCLRLSRESINFFELRKVMNIIFLVQYCVHLMFLFDIITLKLRFSCCLGLGMKWFFYKCICVLLVCIICNMQQQNSSFFSFSPIFMNTLNWKMLMYIMY